jgi:hypothetical protein
MLKAPLKLSFISIALFFSVWGSKPSYALIESPVSILNFQAGAIAVYSASGGPNWSGQIAWTPYFGIGIIGIRGDVGITVLKDILGAYFLAANFEGLVSFPLFPMVAIEAGGGYHTWVGQGAGLAVSAKLVLKIIPGLDRIYIGYSRFTFGTGADEFRGGLGFTL